MNINWHVWNKDFSGTLEKYGKPFPEKSCNYSVLFIKWLAFIL